MVRAVNSGGEAQSIADFRVLEPTPERIVEVVKTVIFDESPMHIPIVSLKQITKSFIIGVSNFFFINV